MSKYNTSTNKRPDDIVNRLVRIESKLVRGFEELGVELGVDKEWLSVEDLSNTVYVSTMGRSMQVIIQEMKARGATKVGEYYEVVCGGEVAAHIKYQPKF